jgi:hypothetical protein
VILDGPVFDNLILVLKDSYGLRFGFAFFGLENKFDLRCKNRLISSRANLA